MRWAASLLAAVFGLVGGSFLSVCAHRLPRGMSVIHPGSRCPRCGHALSGRENLPLLGFLWLRRRCHSCRAPISWRYPLLELGGAAAFWWSWARTSGGVEFVREAFFLALLLGLAATDLACRQLPDEMTLGGAATGLAFALVAPANPPGWAAALAAGLGGAALLALLGVVYRRWRGRAGLGWGDVKMVGMLGAFLGVRGLLVAVFLAAAGGAVVGLAQAALVYAGRRRRGRTRRRARASTALFLARQALPFGAFLSAGGAAAWAWGPLLWRRWLG